MTNQPDNNLDETSRFYDILASDYDSMTNFETRFEQEKPVFRMLIERYGIRTALDAGCGTGFHSLVLAQLGVDVTSADISSEMLAKTSAHARDMNVRIRTINSSFQDLASYTAMKFDAVFCLGNSLVHLLDTTDLEITLKNFSSMLTPGGILIVQVLNYEKILAEKKNIQNLREHGGVMIQREYEYEGKFIVFTIRQRHSGGKESHERAITIRLRPLIRTDIIPMMASSGFASIQTYGGISMIDFDPASSKDLVILAKKTRGDNNISIFR